MIEKHSIKSSQLNAVCRMLALNVESDLKLTSYSTSSNQCLSVPAGASHNQWKVLIYDKPCRSVISPLLSVSQLRARGVTLHMLISSERESIPDVPAVYFVEPTRSNIETIASDCARRLYSRVHLNFVTKLDRSIMEEFACLVVKSNSLDVIASVHDQYLDFVSLEKNLFSLSNKNDSYVAINGSGATDQGIEWYMDRIAYGLFSVFGTIGAVPIIRCVKEGAPEMVARKLSKLIAEHPYTSSIKAHHSRPLLVILDRNMDLITPMQHTSTYQALVDDLLQHSANRVGFTVKNENDQSGKPKVTNKKFDLDADIDPFYNLHKFSPFPEAIENNGLELQVVTTKEKEIRSKTISGGTGSTDLKNTSGESSIASDLANAVESLPTLLEQKKKLEIHTSILQAVMKEVASRDVPQFYELESALATGQYKNDNTKAKKQVLDMVTDPEKGNMEDKLRLVAVYCLATTAPGSDVTDVMTNMTEALATPGIKEGKSKLEKGISAIEYLKNLRSMQMIPNMADVASMQTTSLTSTKEKSDMLSNFMARATNQASGLLAKATEKVGSMLGKLHKHRATRVVENLCEMKPNTEDDEYLYLDPKVKGDVDIKSLRKMTRLPVTDVILFIIGGGCYAEYQNLQMLANDKRIVSYGSTEIISPCEFLEQLGKV